MSKTPCQSASSTERELIFHPSAHEVATTLRQRYADVALFAFGQTPFWDEPMKAILRRMLDDEFPEARMIIGIHDADYFSRNAPPGPEGAFDLFARNDGTTQSLWVAAGEVSCLFGCEEIPRRSLLTQYGVQLEKIASQARKSRAECIDTATEAWGWRGVARHGLAEPSIANIRVTDALPKLIEALEWAERESLKYLASLMDDPGRAPLSAMVEEMRRFAEEHPDASLSELFQYLLPQCYHATVSPLGQIEVSATTKLFRFNRQTAVLPRFRPLDLFLEPSTARAAREAYDAAVADARIYDLSHFPPGAIPFDLLVPGRSRGTLCILEDHVLIESDSSIALDTPGGVKSVEQLADAIEGHLGPNVVLIGKAVAFAAMICSEFIFVLNEEGSRYVAQTRIMTQRLKERGVKLDLHPALRMELDAWSALKGCDFQLLLPRHLAVAFQTDCLPASDFGAQWRTAVRRQERVLKTLRSLKSPEDLMDFLRSEQHEQWLSVMQEYVDAHSTLLAIHSQVEKLRCRAVMCREQSRTLKREAQALQRQKGQYFRQNIRPIQEKLHGLAKYDIECSAEVRKLKGEIRKLEGERERIERNVQRKLKQAQAAQSDQRACTKQYRELETSEKARAARRTLARVERELEQEKLRIVRDALLTTMGLPFTAHRPAAWWLPLVDPSGRWARACAETARFYFEPLG